MASSDRPRSAALVLPISSRDRDPACSLRLALRTHHVPNRSDEVAHPHLVEDTERSRLPIEFIDSQESHRFGLGHAVLDEAEFPRLEWHAMRQNRSDPEMSRCDQNGNNPVAPI